MGHDRGTSVQAAIADVIEEITGKRFRDLPLRQHDLTWGQGALSVRQRTEQ
jgi:CO/xanthine dehydrogenase Mo-binding subunit